MQHAMTLFTYIIVSNIPEKEVEHETNVNSSLRFSNRGSLSTSGDLHGITGSFTQSLCVLLCDNQNVSDRMVFLRFRWHPENDEFHRSESLVSRSAVAASHGLVMLLLSLMIPLHSVMSTR
jgi:hypothetical protein